MIYVYSDKCGTTTTVSCEDCGKSYGFKGNCERAAINMTRGLIFTISRDGLPVDLCSKCAAKQADVAD